MCLLDMTVIYVYSLCNVYGIYLTLLQFSRQGDSGLTGPPGTPGPTVSEIFFD